MLTEKPKEEMINRLKGSRGKLRGFVEWWSRKRMCGGPAPVWSGSRRSRQAAQAVLSAHIDSCVSTSLEKGDLEDRKAKLTELVELFDRYGRVIGR